MLNRVVLIGYVGSDAEVRVLETGNKTASFRLATTERYVRRDGSWGEHTEWHSIVAWRGEAAVAAEMLAVRGANLHIEGSIRSRSSVNPKTKQEQTHYEILAQTIRPADDSTPIRPATLHQPPASPVDPTEAMTEDPDGLPF